jgi:hypothetical protein
MDQVSDEFFRCWLVVERCQRSSGARNKGHMDMPSEVEQRKELISLAFVDRRSTKGKAEKTGKRGHRRCAWSKS